jgi:hypothetical protein|tara:strand:- start:1710 stop:1967 length:258 start_codon:yes stop_codon:yes gene_type:complete
LLTHVIPPSRLREHRLFLIHSHRLKVCATGARYSDSCTAITPEKNPNIPFELAELKEVQAGSYLRKIRNFEAIFASDICLGPRYE